MKILHILKSEPDNSTKILIDIISKDESCVIFPLYKEHPDYGKLIELIFDCDKTVSWW